MELKKMFTYLLESERKAYNPRSFCKVYTMDHQPLNTGEQKDMTEFFTDLITKLEEMGPELVRCFHLVSLGFVYLPMVVWLSGNSIVHTSRAFLCRAQFSTEMDGHFMCRVIRHCRDHDDKLTCGFS